MKQEFLQELLSIPESVHPWVIGSVGHISSPSSVDDAVIAMGQLSANINDAVLKPLQGIDLTELILRVGQRNDALIAMLLSNLQLINMPSGVPVSVESPMPGETYYLASGLPVRVVSPDIIAAEAWLFDSDNVKTILQPAAEEGAWEDILTTSGIEVQPGVDVVVVTVHISCVVRGKDAPVKLTLAVDMLPGGEGA